MEIYVSATVRQAAPYSYKSERLGRDVHGYRIIVDNTKSKSMYDVVINFDVHEDVWKRLGLDSESERQKLVGKSVTMQMEASWYRGSARLAVVDLEINK